MPYFPPGMSYNDDAIKVSCPGAAPMALASKGLPAADGGQRIRIKNRRKRYLDHHPDYFGPSLELAGLPTSRQDFEWRTGPQTDQTDAGLQILFSTIAASVASRAQPSERPTAARRATRACSKPI